MATTSESARKSVARTPATAPENSLSWPASANVRRAFSDRLILSEAIDLVGKIVDAYPNGRAAVTDSYLGNMANLLCQYPRLVALRCADPARGVTTKTKFIPTVADVVEWCEPLTKSMHTSVLREDRIDAQLRERDEFERQFPSQPNRFPRRLDPAPDVTGKHPAGTILADYDAAIKLYGRPIGAFDDDRVNVYGGARR